MRFLMLIPCRPFPQEAPSFISSSPGCAEQPLAAVDIAQQAGVPKKGSRDDHCFGICCYQRGAENPVLTPGPKQQELLTHSTCNQLFDHASVPLSVFLSRWGQPHCNCFIETKLPCLQLPALEFPHSCVFRNISALAFAALITTVIWHLFFLPATL